MFCVNVFKRLPAVPGTAGMSLDDAPLSPPLLFTEWKALPIGGCDVPIPGGKEETVHAFHLGEWRARVGPEDFTKKKKKKVNKGGKKGLWRGPEEGWWCRVKIHSKAGFTLVQLWFPAWGCLFTSSGANQLWIFAWIRTCTEPYWTVERSRPRPVWTGSIASQAHSHVMRIRCSKKSASNWHICEPSPKEMYGNTKKTYILTSMLQLWCDAAAVPHQLWE